MRPDVDKTGSVAVERGESSAFPERLVEVRVQDLKEERIDVGEEVFLRPFETECVGFGGIGGVKGGSLYVGTPPGIVSWVRTPVKG